MVIEHGLEPSYALLDAGRSGTTIQDQATGLFVFREVNITRVGDNHVKDLEAAVYIETDKLLAKSEQAVPDQPVSAEMQVFQALRGRGIALAFTDSLTCEVHGRYLQRLFQHMRNDAAEGYAKTTLQQVLRADRVFLHMIQRDVSMRRPPDNILPMDTAILEAVASYEVGFSLMPLPKKSEKVEPKASAPSSTYGGWQDGRRNTQQPYQKGQGWQRKRERKESCWHGSKGASRQEVVL